MFKITLLLLTIFITNAAISKNKQIRIGIIDTGFNNADSVKLCPGFESLQKEDLLNHGTEVLEVLKSELDKDADICYVLIAIDHKSNISLLNGLRDASKANLDFLNLSYTGPEPLELEKYYIMHMVDKGTKVVTVSGNVYKNLDEKCDVYPACYDPKIYVAGSSTSKLGYGSIVDAYLPDTAVTKGNNQYGTSFSAPRLVAKLANEMSKK